MSAVGFNLEIPQRTIDLVLLLHRPIEMNEDEKGPSDRCGDALDFFFFFFASKLCSWLWDVVWRQQTSICCDEAGSVKVNLSKAILDVSLGKSKPNVILDSCSTVQLKTRIGSHPGPSISFEVENHLRSASGEISVSGHDLRVWLVSGRRSD